MTVICPCLWSDLSEPLSCLSAQCLTSGWCSTGLREDQALPELALPLSPVQQELWEHIKHIPPSPHFRPQWTDELFLSKNMCALLDHQRRLNGRQRLLRVSRTTKENKKAPVGLDSFVTGHRTGIAAWSWWPLCLFYCLSPSDLAWLPTC